MKKVIILLFLLIFMIPVVSISETTLSDYTFEQIQKELDTYNQKIWQSGNWSSVIVPSGDYVVGVDLPAGEYWVKAVEGFAFLYRWSKDDQFMNINSDEPRYLEETIEEKKFLLDLEDGDQLNLRISGLIFFLSDYKPRFTVDEEQEKLVQTLKDEYKLYEAELRSRPEWKEIKVPEGLYEVGPQIPVGKWTIWPEEFSRAGAHYGEGLTKDGKINYSLENAALKDGKMASFKLGFHQDRISIDAQEGYYFEFDNTVIFTPYAGKTPFGFNE